LGPWNPPLPPGGQHLGGFTVVYIPPCVTPCANILKLFRERERQKGGDPEFCWTSTGRGPAAVFFCIIHPHRWGAGERAGSPNIWTLDSFFLESPAKYKKEKGKKSEIFPISKDSGALLSRSTILTDM
jgi:hypothetical protein